LRRENDWLLTARVVRDLSTTLKLSAGYEFGRLGSNGDFVDFGPFQSQLQNDLGSDDRIVGDYYSHRRHELHARLRKLVRKGLYVAASARYRDRAYSGRFAKDALDQFLVPAELRHDRVWQLSATVDLPIPHVSQKVDFGHFGLRLRVFHESSRSNEALYDFGHNSVTLSLTSWF
jgi:hypothetical protein